MDVRYSKKMEKVCTNAAEARKKHGQRMAREISACIDALRAADSVEELIQGHIFRCHALVENRKGQYAMDLVQPYRLIFEKGDDGVLYVTVIEIVDYH